MGQDAASLSSSCLNIPSDETPKSQPKKCGTTHSTTDLSAPMYKWSASQVHQWLTSLDSGNSTLQRTADTLQQQGIHGLSLTGINYEYLSSLGIDTETSTLILAELKRFEDGAVHQTQAARAPHTVAFSLGNVANLQADVSELDNAAMPSTSLNNYDSLKVPGPQRTLRSIPSTEETDVGRDDNTQFVVTINVPHTATDIEPDVEHMDFSTLDQDLLNELVNIGTSVLSEHFTKSVSTYHHDGILSPRRTDAPAPGDPPEQQSNAHPLTAAQSIEAKSVRASNCQFVFNLNPCAPEWQPAMHLTGWHPHNNTKWRPNMLKRTQSAPNLEPILEIPDLAVAQPEMLSFEFSKDKSGVHALKISVPERTDTKYEQSYEPLYDHDDEQKTATTVKKRYRVMSKFDAERVRKNMTISSKMTKLMDSAISERIPDLYTYLDYATFMQCFDVQCNADNSIKVYDYDLHDKQSGAKLYCIARKKSGGATKWKMDEKLYTAEQVQQQHMKIPVSVREHPQYKTEVDSASALQVALSQKMNVIEKKTKWTDARLMVNPLLNNKLRRILAMTKEEFLKQFQEYHKHRKQARVLIPVVAINADYLEDFVPNDDKKRIHFHIQHVEIVPLAANGTHLAHVGIAYELEKKNASKEDAAKKVYVKGIYVNKQDLKLKHWLVNPQHIAECHCLDHFETNFDVVRIGNVKSDQNKINDLQKKLEKMKNEKQELLNQLAKLRNAPPSETGMSSPSSFGSPGRAANGVGSNGGGGAHAPDTWHAASK